MVIVKIIILWGIQLETLKSLHGIHTKFLLLHRRHYCKKYITACKCHICGSSSYLKYNYNICRETDYVTQFMKRGTYNFNLRQPLGEDFNYIFEANMANGKYRHDFSQKSNASLSSVVLCHQGN